MSYSWKIGDKLVLKEKDKEELVSTFIVSRGMSGVPPSEVNKTFTFLNYYGNNARVEYDEGSPLSLNHSRFKKPSKLNR